MSQLDWSYHRPGCKTCARAQAFLERHKMPAATTVVNAIKTKMGRSEALKLAHQVEEIYATKGTKLIHIDMKKDKPDEERLTELLLGPTGNLRAPALRADKVLLVGFDEVAYRKVLGK
jgi:arsenate reductase-like glutaredoxin family protein